MYAVFTKINRVLPTVTYNIRGPASFFCPQGPIFVNFTYNFVEKNIFVKNVFLFVKGPF